MPSTMSCIALNMLTVYLRSLNGIGTNRGTCKHIKRRKYLKSFVTLSEILCTTKKNALEWKYGCYFSVGTSDNVAKWS
jgi:hypothetical protein